MESSIKSRQDSVKLLRLSTEFEISVDHMSVFLWSLLNLRKNFSGVGRIVAQSATVLPTFFYRVTKNIGRIVPPAPEKCLGAGRSS